MTIATAATRPPASRNATSTRCPGWPSTGRCQASHSSRRPFLDTVTRRDAPGRSVTERSTTDPSAPGPPVRSRPMFRRNSRIRGLSAFSAAAISRVATSAGTASWSNGNTNSVSAIATATGASATGRTKFSIPKCSSPLWMRGVLVYAYTDLKPMPNLPIEVRSPAFPLWPTPHTPRTSASVNGRPSCRSSSRSSNSSKASSVAPASSAFWISSKMKWVRSL